MIIFKTLFKTLNQNTSSFTITDEAISNNSIFEVYPSDDSVILADVTVNGTTANIIFDSAAEYNIPCAVFINNLVGAYEPESGLPDPTNKNGYTLRVHDNIANWELVTAGNILYKDSNVYRALEELEDELHENTVPDGVLYHATSGNIWKKLDASNIDYDSDSTIYSAMGDVDDLETESNNLVDAINEVNAKSSGGITYSTEEVDTGKIWIDGKHIYTKVFVFNTPRAADTTIDFGFTLDTLINVTGEMDNGSNKFPVNTVWVSTSNIYCLIIDASKTKFLARTPLASSCKIVFEYTKAV